MKRAAIILFASLLVQSLVAQDGMTPERIWELKRLGGEVVSPDGKFIAYTVAEYNVYDNKGEANIFLTEVATGSTRQITTSIGNEHSLQWNPVNGKIGYVLAGNWLEIDVNGANTQIVLDYDFPIGNVRYSPNGARLAFTAEVKMSQTLQEIYPGFDKAEVKLYDDLMYRHWDSWSDEMVSHIFYVDVSNGQPTSAPMDIMPGEAWDAPTGPFGGGEEITWTKDSEAIIYSCKKLKGKDFALSTNTDLYAYNIQTGGTRNLTEGMMGYDNHPAVSADGKHLYWLSMTRNGYESDKNNLMMMDLATGKKINLTEAFPETVNSFAVGNGVVYLEIPENGTQQIYQLTLPKKSGAPVLPDFKRLTSGDYNYMAPQIAGGFLVVGRTDFNHAKELFKIDLKKLGVSALTGVNDEIYARTSMSRFEKRMMTTTDGKQMLTWVIYPPDFDPNKKYPTLLYCQGGPQSQVSQFYSFRWNFQLMAAKGYIVVAPNRRGLPGFGVEWNEQISGDWGGQPMRDYLTAIDEMAKEAFVDSERLGAVGASYGGYSVYMLAGIHEKRFKTFVSHCGLFNMESWYGTTEEMFFANWDVGGPYWGSNPPKTYSEFSPHKYVDKWDTPIFVIHGGRDYRVPDTQGLEAFQAAQLRGIPSRLMYFPNEGHWVMKPQNSVVWHTEFFKWLDIYLMP
jgi:dipeptidyl aminopeptidase/acylaminoacyl peptidase